MKTAKTRSPTRDRLLDAAERLMLTKGFSATTIEEICEAAKLTKGSLFHYFDTKEELGQVLLERFCASAQQRMEQTGADRESDPLKRVYRAIDAAIQMARECRSNQSCLLGSFAQELSDTHPKIRSCCEQAFAQWAKTLQRDLDDAKACYAPKASFETKSLAEHFIAIVEGSKILAKAKQDVRMVEQSLGHLRRYLEALYGR